MKIDTMRKVDYFAGVPLCFFATIFVWFTNLFAAKKQKTSKVLFVELSEMGSAILVDPAMRKMQTKVGAELFFVIFKSNLSSM